MQSHEAVKSEVPANQRDLTRLAILTQGWLKANGSTRLDPHTEVQGLENDHPIIEGYDLPRVEYTASNEAVRAVAPEAADTFGLHGPLTIISYEPHYSLGDAGELVSSEQATCFVITQEPHLEKQDTDTDLYIYQTGETGAWVSNRVTEDSEGNARGSNFMTEDEFGALYDIVKKLDDIKAFDERLAKPTFISGI